MARLNTSINPSKSPSQSSIYRDPTPPGEPSSTARRPARSTRSAFSPSAGSSSDKENSGDPMSSPRLTMDKGKGRARSPTTFPTPTSEENQTPRPNKRRRLQDRDRSARDASTAPIQNGDSITGTEFYDPEQDPEERRRLREEQRHLQRDFNESRDEILAENGTTKLDEFVDRANRTFGRVKQTSDATLDSRLMIQASELTLRKTTQLVMGDNSAGIDIDEFVSKCITFMQSGGNRDENADIQPLSTQAHARRQAARLNHNDSDDEQEQEESGDAYAWDVLGEQACFCHNQRPPAPGFLLGPLSVQKRVRPTQTTQRRGRLRVDASQAKRPQSLEPEDIQRNDNNSAMSAAGKIRNRLIDVLRSRTEAFEAEAEELAEELVEEKAPEIMEKHGLVLVDQEANLNLFEFFINPHSYGQSVENIFHICFLIKEGQVNIRHDKDGYPTICPMERSERSEQEGSGGVRKYQAIFTLDVPTWRKLIRGFDIREPLIPHRQEEQPARTVRGWYG
ncbi:Nse4 C-terminal-domain-containing protein [Phyllosticta capitalensis]|uniref:Non-structural maintenance of chromosomes element 4 n=1 Tax=Phyllosticta capitalensis TaxID=121624 RepID=A0ABR1YUF2_9PEZI